MEYFDVLDKKRNFLNKTYVRGTKLSDDEYNQGVEIYITCQNKLLMSERCELKSHPLEWEVPGGCSQAGEDSLTTLKRELQEEIGYSLEFEPKLIDTIIYKNQFVDIYTIDIPEFIHNFKLQAEEVSNIKWLNKEEFEDLKEKQKIVASVLNRYEQVKEKINLDW